MYCRTIVLAALAVGFPVAIRADDFSTKRDSVSSSAAEIDTAWRNASHGGLNALYCLLRIHGSRGDYTTCMDAAHGAGLPQSVADVVSFSSRLGSKVAARRVSPKELASLKLPVLIHLEGDVASTGCFAVLLQRQAKQLVFFNGASATVDTISNETFLRRWSGVVIVPAPNRIHRLVSLSCGVLCGLGAFAIWNRFREAWFWNSKRGRRSTS
jgi:hypothetical protein